MEPLDDPLWPHFERLWPGILELCPGTRLAGGYGLFLKQKWLRSVRGGGLFIPLDRWRDGIPRVTKDMDLVVGLDLIMDADRNRQCLGLLRENGFEVSERQSGKRWQFFKPLDEKRNIVVELHAPTPPEDFQGIRADRIRVKHNPSLGEDGVHGRHNAEAAGSELIPFWFEMNGLKIAVTNPVTLAVMKVTAAGDQWQKYRAASPEYPDREFHRLQAVKHGQDVCRAVAMMGDDEFQKCGGVVSKIRETPAFQKAMGLTEKLFGETSSWAEDYLSQYWEEEDVNQIQNKLGNWFQPLPPVKEAE